jgi:hypothetical protein
MRSARLCRILKRRRSRKRFGTDLLRAVLLMLKEMAKSIARRAGYRPVLAGDLMRQPEAFQDRVIREHVGGLSFIDVGGLWGTLNEKVSVARLAGARSVAMADAQPHGSSVWQDFRDRCAALGVSDYSEHCVNLDDPSLREKLGSFDFVHCSGVIYHMPSPLHGIEQLATIANRYLLLGSMVVPERISNRAGTIEFAGGLMLFLPGIDAHRRAIMARHFDAIGIKIAHINADWPDPFRLGGQANYSPWWWLYSATTLRAILEASGLKVLDQAPCWDNRVSYCFCEKARD